MSARDGENTIGAVAAVAGQAASAPAARTATASSDGQAPGGEAAAEAGRSAWHVLHVLDHSIPLQSGYVYRTLSILAHQRARGWRTTQLTGPRQGDSVALLEQVDGWDFHRTPARRSSPWLPGWKYLAVARAIEQRLLAVAREQAPDIIHAHSPALNALAALRVGRRLGIPVVYEVRAFWEDAAADHGTSREGGLRYRLSRALETRVLRRAAAVTTICEGLRDDIVARGVPAERVTVIPNAVDVERFRLGGKADPERRTRLGLDGARVLGFLGSFYAYEGLDVLLRALPRIRESAPDVRLLLVGGGPQEENLKALAAELGIADYVVFAGRVPHTEVNHYYDLVDVLVYPRRPIRLTELVTPLKPLEAMAQGRLLVASDVGGHRELIRDGETGILFRAGDPDDLARSVLELLAAGASWPALRRRARRYVENERTWASSVARYESVYAPLAPAGPKP